jgi:hypothetical protein
VPRGCGGTTGKTPVAAARPRERARESGSRRRSLSILLQQNEINLLLNVHLRAELNKAVSQSTATAFNSLYSHHMSLSRGAGNTFMLEHIILDVFSASRLLLSSSDR